MRLPQTERSLCERIFFFSSQNTWQEVAFCLCPCFLVFQGTRVLYLCRPSCLDCTTAVVSLLLSFFLVLTCSLTVPRSASSYGGTAREAGKEQLPHEPRIVLTFPDDWIPLIMARQTKVQAASRDRVIFQLRPPPSEMLSEMSRAWRYQ